MENYIEELEDLLPKYIQRKPEEVEKYTTQQLEDYMALIGDIIKLLLKVLVDNPSRLRISISILVKLKNCYKD